MLGNFNHNLKTGKAESALIFATINVDVSVG